ncbi:hypothetical protein D823_01140 [Streptococcus sobrinus DSM 20742 = ATCC 33478]|uniref:Uncharacterized protein n=1 Tax=Streptococcus sobrinus W1703 TaxID=1227275 RepID=U2IVP2_9STRE|nr:hypothetical protein D823_01140 [Streptococcus sobrinus DSM 20742 = ATCC 33478]ERJ78016.1 hypothetical protein HMPREF1557_00447 [Streptococcus sobrinus W1703]
MINKDRVFARLFLLHLKSFDKQIKGTFSIFSCQSPFFAFVYELISKQDVELRYQAVKWLKGLQSKGVRERSCLKHLGAFLFFHRVVGVFD